MTLTPIVTDTQDEEDKARKSLRDEAFQLALSVDVIARTVWGEARGEGSAGMQAVANVIFNRYIISEQHGGFWWGNSFVEICQKPYQFSCWNENDPNLAKILAVDTDDLYFATAKRMARRCVTRALSDVTHGATHYHSAGIHPHWAEGVTPVATIGAHHFYCLTD